MINFKKAALISAISLGALLYLSAPQSSAHRIQPYYTHHISRYGSVGHPLFGELRHSSANWTFNGQSKLWNVPDNDGQRIPVMDTQQVRHIAKHARHQRNPNHLFYLDYTATYKGRIHPTYYYIESYSEKIHGWIYHNGLVQAGRDHHTNADTIAPNDIYIPRSNHLTKLDYENANDIKAELLGDLLKHDKSEYSNDLFYAKWEANNLGKIKHHTRKQKIQLIRKAAHEANAMFKHAKHSRKYKRYLERQLMSV